MCGNKENCCISEILRKILILQRQDFDNECFAGCDKPFLGPIPTQVCYNTRPIQLYNCSTGTPWTFSYTGPDGTQGNSNVFRVESIDDCCCTLRILYYNPADPTQPVGTREFVTVDLSCCGAIRCLPDTYIDLC